jgi:cytochrome P450
MRLLAQQAVIAEKTLQLRAQVRSFEAVCRMVQVGLGAGLLPASAAQTMGPSMGLVVRPLADAWAERRAVIAPALHPSRIGAFHAHVIRAAEELAEDLARAAPGPVDVAPLFATATTRV